MRRFIPLLLAISTFTLVAGCPGTHDKVPADGAPPVADKGNLVKLDTTSSDAPPPDQHLVPKKDLLPLDQFIVPDQPYNPTWRGPGGAGQGWRLPR